MTAVPARHRRQQPVRHCRREPQREGAGSDKTLDPHTYSHSSSPRTDQPRNSDNSSPSSNADHCGTTITSHSRLGENDSGVAPPVGRRITGGTVSSVRSGPGSRWCDHPFACTRRKGAAMGIVGVCDGVDTHADVHMAAAIDHDGGWLGVPQLLQPSKDLKTESSMSRLPFLASS